MGGDHATGVLYRMDTSGSNFSVIHHFDGPVDGGNPFGKLLIVGTTIYAINFNDGPLGAGTIYRIDTSGDNFAVLHVFDAVSGDGYRPKGGLLLASDGRLYGTTENGPGPGNGTVFGLETDGSGYATLHGFIDASDGQDPLTELIEAPDGYLWGTTPGGGSGGNGVVFRMRRDGTDYSVVHAFSPGEGTAPLASVTRVGGGLLYGTTTGGGAGSAGVVYRMTTLGTLFRSAYEFSSVVGPAGPNAAVIQGADGALYGTTTIGGDHGDGAIFRLTIPAVIAIGPSSGAASGGTPVAIAGTAFQDGAGVFFDGVSATNASILDPSNATAAVPVLAPGTLADVALVNPDHSIGFLSRAYLADFLDVPQGDLFHGAVEEIFRDGVTAGCGGGRYCRNASVRRDQAAVLLLKSKHGEAFLPPACVGAFPDVPCPGPFTAWVEQLAREGITGGCGAGLYCPGADVTRAQMAAFLLKGEHGADYVPPVCVGVFDDVPCPGLFADWIEQLYVEGVTGGCGTGPLVYCPEASVTRGQMAAFLVQAFSLP
jgi:uncharacterized repeat protein (TIGR03803 family)